MGVNVEDFVEKIVRLEPEMQKNIIWIMDNIDLVDRMLKRKMSKEVWEEDMRISREKNDQMAIVLLTYKKILDEENETNRKV